MTIGEIEKGFSRLTPNEVFGEISESLIQYLEAQYRIAHSSVYNDRGRILRSPGVVAQSPYIEATPSFPTGRKLADIERSHPEFLPSGLAELVLHGVPVDRFPLYEHQEAALKSAFGESPNLLVATGTGSGKTESFLLPILADILNEATTWQEIMGGARRGRYDEQNDIWVHSRRHERRPAAVRAIILYPMNALVNDQLSRLRRILARGTSPDWQRRNLKGNLIHFAMYTGMTSPTGSWKDKWRRDKHSEYMHEVDTNWVDLEANLRDTGGWPRPDGPEMLSRWDIQAAPPDILVTNYSMLEYMLIRPIEYGIFETTRKWLEENPEGRLTLVLDEAHTYTGAKGTEVAHLVRRLKERLGISRGSSQFRAIATTASVPQVEGAQSSLTNFVSELFDEPPPSFSMIGLRQGGSNGTSHVPTLEALQRFEEFYNVFSVVDPLPAIEQLAKSLGVESIDLTEPPQVTLFNLLESDRTIAWIRARTARNATVLDALAEECWAGLGTLEQRSRATAGVLAAGSFSRAEALPDTPPLLSMRIHGFFRGITGIWACMDPDCPHVLEVDAGGDDPRPVGKIYTEPRPWCECGARVLEVFTCRHCGLLFLGGIPDSLHGSLWPWSDDLSGNRQDLHDFRIFGAEKPYPEAAEKFRSTRTTLEIHSNEIFARRTYEIEPAIEKRDGIEVEVSPFPAQCPRCERYRQRGSDGREVIESLRTRGPQSFAAILEESFRNQPRTSVENPPNYGRKALVFSDSRQEAAILAANLRGHHEGDLFRQLLYRSLVSCDECVGAGQITATGEYLIGQEPVSHVTVCPDCSGTGRQFDPRPLSFEQLRQRVLQMQLDRGINPTGETISDFFSRLEGGDLELYSDAETAFNVALRRELSEDDFSLEPLALGSWRVKTPERTGSFEHLTEEESQGFMRSIARILATEDVLLPPEPHVPWGWPKDLTRPFERRVLIPHSRVVDQRMVPYNLTTYRKLGRFVHAIAYQLVELGRIPTRTAADKWVKDLYWPIWNAMREFKILQGAGAKIDGKVPAGIRIDRFELHPVGDFVVRCRSCAYVMSETVLGICRRCGSQTDLVPVISVRNYFRRLAKYADPGMPYDDPYPLRASEHTAQIATEEARNEERWFQDFFRGYQNRHDHRIDVLSVTTTMEMGIDIGNLLCVGLRNVPPTVANYQQRAGRAGRRGSALATVLTFAQQRSHDQYYFERPPEIVSNPPRIPSLYLGNPIFARRHIRSMVLQGFFLGLRRDSRASSLFDTWGTAGEFASRQQALKLREYVAGNKAVLIQKCRQVVHARFHSDLETWIEDIVEEVQSIVIRSARDAPIFEEMIASGLLPKYAFPVDVVGLHIPQARSYDDDETLNSDAMQRDLKIAIAEYAPGAEVVRGSFPKTYKYRSAGLYDPFEKSPDYRPSGVFVECRDCQSVTLHAAGEVPSDTCLECGSFNLVVLDYVRPQGFTVDAALPYGGRKEYERDGRERSGYAEHARLLMGQTSFSRGEPHDQLFGKLYTTVRTGELFTCNKGSNNDFPGFLICPTCGRYLDAEDPVSHTYPADVPPHLGRQSGPRAGDRCPNRGPFDNHPILGYSFFSEIILMGIDLPPHLDAPFDKPSGRAIWHSFGTLIANAASRLLQIDPGELKAGSRPVKRESGRLHGEVFLYDDVPGGAGYARGVDEHLGDILRKASELGANCMNPSCGGACYECMYDYRNQYLHPFLDRHLGVALLNYLIYGTQPTLGDWEADVSAGSLEEFARADWDIRPGFSAGSIRFPLVLEDRASGDSIALSVLHPLEARPSTAVLQSITAEYGVRCAMHTSFDLMRRPFWVLNNLITT